MKFKLVEKRKEIGNIYSFIFKPSKPFKWIAGQYLIYSLDKKNNDLRGKQRFFTISSSPFEKLPKITTRIFTKNPSSFKTHLNNLKIGETINAKGPDGDFVVNKQSKNYVFIASGIGITPFISILRELNFAKQKINITLLYANKNKKEILFKKELEEIKNKHKEFKINYIFKPNRINKVLLSRYENFKAIYYISGPDPMVDEIFNILRELKIKEENIRMDYFSGYKN